MHKIFSNLLVETSKDGLKGYITLLDNEDENKITEEKNIGQIIEEVKNIFKVGVDEGKLKDLLLNEYYNDKTCIARGELPINGKDGYIKYNFDLEKKFKPKILEDGTVDYRELDIINNVAKGDVLAELVPPKEGKPGLKVTGDTISYRKGKYPKFKYGKNVKLLDNKLALVAEKDGLVTLTNGKIKVLDVYEVKNVDNNVGNIYFDGTVIVKGNVLNGFQIKANGDVNVKGVIEGSYIENTGDIVIKKGIQGYNKLVIRTKGNITTRFIENAIINSQKNIVAEAIMHSEISCRGSINVIGKRGLIVGGVCKAKKEIKAKTIGSTMATLTILEVGIDPQIKSRNEELIDRIDELEKNMNKIIKSLNLLGRLKKAGKLDEDKKNVYAKLVKTRDNMMIKLKDLKMEQETIKESIENVSKGRIKVSDTIHPGVKIIIGNRSMSIRDEMKRCTFYLDEGEIKVGPYQE